MSTADIGTISGIFGIFAAASILINLISIAVGVFTLVCMWKIFFKMGIEGWKCLIPFYNMYVMSQAVWGEGWKFIFFFIPFVNIYFLFKFYIDIAHCFGKSTGFGVGLVFLNTIFLAILAFGKDIDYSGSGN